ncbi:hypothetical protein MIND_00668200 [Mycena indigotica]|uniref:Transmembrane protein n=1 Tax=Mycena indigotica TaxID=2126181 RepID=A0A8H6W6G6_9AGAR|nr:uncharacterized protein MIND_00668200 [Mycena indigotica]KAF7301044.1 hypothetical protein MIND_00668200 [Mycena indigotica]
MPFGIEKVFRRSQPSEGILDKHNATRNVPQWTKTANPEFFPTSCSVSVIEPVISNTIVLGYLLLTIVCVWLSLAPHNFKRRRRGWSVYAVLAVSAVIRMCPLDWTAPSLSSILSYAFSVVPQLCTHELFFGLTSHLLCFLCAQLVFHLHQRLPPTHPDTVFVHMLIWVIPLAINMTSANLNRTFWLLYQTGCNIRTLPTVSQLRYGILRLHELCVLPSTLGQANKTIIHGSLLANLLIFGICLALSNLHRAARARSIQNCATMGLGLPDPGTKASSFGVFGRLLCGLEHPSVDTQTHCNSAGGGLLWPSISSPIDSAPSQTAESINRHDVVSTKTATNDSIIRNRAGPHSAKFF